MPSPLDIFLHPVSLIAIGIYAALMLWEFTFPARRLAAVKYWRLRGLIAFVVYFFLSSYLPLLWDGALAQYQLFNVSSLHVALQVAIGIAAYELMAYWYHRAMHSNDTLWRVFHQMHHSAERLDTFGAFWLSPNDIAGFTFVSSFSLVMIVGLNPTAATIVMLFLVFCAIFQHTNVKTPRWLGYFIQRPESHSWHHAKHVHRDNYADLPVFDILFGTFKNPQQFYDTGFYPGASSRVFEMLTFRPVHKPRGLDNVLELASTKQQAI